MTSDTIHWSTLKTPLGESMLVVTPKGVCEIALPGTTRPEFRESLQRQYPDAVIAEDEQATRTAAEELQQYWRGEAVEFSSQLDLHGTDFQRAVWQALRRIPRGETVTYGQVAEAVGSPRAYQAVGRAVGANPVPIMIPCHRVIGADGSLTGFASGLDTKRWLLEHEGGLPSEGSLKLKV